MCEYCPIVSKQDILNKTCLLYLYLDSFDKQSCIAQSQGNESHYTTFYLYFLFTNNIITIIK